MDKEEAARALAHLDKEMGDDEAAQVRILAQIIGENLAGNQALVKLMGILAVYRQALITIQETTVMALRPQPF